MVISNVDKQHRRKYDSPAYINNPFLYSDSYKIYLDFSNQSEEKQKPLVGVKSLDSSFYCKG